MISTWGLLHSSIINANDCCIIWYFMWYYWENSDCNNRIHLSVKLIHLWGSPTHPTNQGVTYPPTRGSPTNQLGGHLSPTLQGKVGWVYLIRSHLTPNGTRWCWKKLWLQVNCKKTSLCPIVAPGFDRTHSSVGGEHWTERTQEQRQMIGELRCHRYWVMIVWQSNLLRFFFYRTLSLFVGPVVPTPQVWYLPKKIGLFPLFHLPPNCATGLSLWKVLHFNQQHTL